MLVFRTSLLMRSGLALMVSLLVWAATAPVAQAQNPFAPVRKVNDRIITNFDIEQRISFLTLLNSGGGDLREEALLRLTQEAVQRDQARRLNIRVNSDEIAEGIAEFASRAELTSDEFVAALAEGGVARETIVAFVEAGLLWRKVVAQRLPPLVQVGPADAERARDISAILGRERVMISEIFLPTDPQFAEPVAQIMGMIEAATTSAEFSDIAREFSLAGSRDQGGMLPDWVAMDNLPAQIRGPLATASPGQIVGPIDMGPEVFAYFQLRAKDSSRDIPPDRVQLTYKRLALPDPDGASTAALLAAISRDALTCPQLAPFARGLPEGALQQREALVNDIPRTEALELARLDRYGISTNLVEAGQRIVLMLCARQLQFDEEPSDDQVLGIVFDRRLSDLAELRLQELVADADIQDF
ncbi:MAG: peptidylprolyl isomerase [Roseinatronobacter sp.]|nr:peptidylprolyl isomerase [Roseinatronobacter sp.]